MYFVHTNDTIVPTIVVQYLFKYEYANLEEKTFYADLDNVPGVLVEHIYMFQIKNDR